MYEPRAYEKANKDIKVNIAGSTPSLGRAVYMLRDWYKFPNLLQTLRQDPNAVLHGYDIGEDLSAQSLGLPSAQAQDRGTVEMKRLPLNNVTRSIADWYGK
jgi:hypothetical protein